MLREMDPIGFRLSYEVRVEAIDSKLSSLKQ